jgi:hypothetical protein
MVVFLEVTKQGENGIDSSTLSARLIDIDTNSRVIAYESDSEVEDFVTERPNKRRQKVTGCDISCAMK